MGTHLTERIVKAAEIGTRKYVVFDEDCAGFSPVSSCPAVRGSS